MKLIITAGDACEHGVPWQRHGQLTMILDCAQCAFAGLVRGGKIDQDDFSDERGEDDKAPSTYREDFHSDD